MFEKPTKPYKNIKYAIKSVGYNVRYDKKHRLNEDNFFPCYLCGGSGIVIHPNEVPDVVEGYRHARRIDCSECKGSGEIDKKRFMQFYRDKIDKYKQQKKAYEQVVSCVESAMLKLSKEEIVILREHFNHHVFGVDVLPFLERNKLSL